MYGQQDKLILKNGIRRYKNITALSAVENDVIVGFGDIDKTGYLDRLFVHKDNQRKGIATAICNQLEQFVEGNITTHASITARPFFEKRGYKVVMEQQAEKAGRFSYKLCYDKGTTIYEFDGELQYV